MEAFVSRKRKRLSPQPQTSEAKVVSFHEAEDNDSTDFKLALLSSLHPYVEQQVLLDILLAHNGSVENATASLTNSDSPLRKSSTAALGYQSSLSAFIGQSGNPSNLLKQPKLLSKKGKTLHLYDPADVAAHTPCSIIHNFLPAEEANALLEELLEEAPTFEKMSFKLFDNVVQSPHTACFYVETYEEMQRQKTEYIYNGGKLTDIRELTPHMRLIAPKVATTVNTEISARIKTHYSGHKLQYQSLNAWKPNAAFVNCYAGGGESVGYHSDQLTYLGPRAVIGSLSLGVAREFRVRRIVTQEESNINVTEEASSSTTSDVKARAKLKGKPNEDADLAGQISIHLPHNCLLIMHAEMQESWKHSVAPCPNIIPHPISGNIRISITYRDYKANLHPKFTPRCRCGVPAVLRVVQRKKTNYGKYFWMCHAGNVPEKGKGGCEYFEWAVFTDDGEPVWKDREK